MFITHTIIRDKREGIGKRKKFTRAYPSVSLFPHPASIGFGSEAWSFPDTTFIRLPMRIWIQQKRVQKINAKRNCLKGNNRGYLIFQLITCLHHFLLSFTNNRNTHVLCFIMVENWWWFIFSSNTENRKMFLTLKNLLLKMRSNIE